MAIESHLKTYLLAKGKLPLRDIGTFTTEDKAATSTAEQILPPQKIISFEETVEPEAYDKFCRELAEKLELDLGEFTTQIENFITTQKNELEKLHRKDISEVKLEGIGFFTLENNKLLFKPSNVNLEGWNNTFGLAPLTNFTTNSAPEVTKKRSQTNKFLPWLIVISSIVIIGTAVWFIYLNYKPSSSQPTPVVTQPKDSATQKPVAQVPDTIQKKDTKPPSQSPPAKTTPEQSIIIRQPTHKYYFIVGSYLTSDNAQLAVSKYVKAGHEKLNIIEGDSKHRVAMGGPFARKQDARTFGQQIKMEGWILYHQ